MSLIQHHASTSETLYEPFSVKHHITLPLLVFLLVASLFEYFQFDLDIAQYIFDWQGGLTYWPLKTQWFTSTIMHTGGRDLVILLGVLLFTALGLSFKIQYLNQYSRNLFCLAMSVVSSILIVKFAKDFTHVNCPCDLTRFGGHVAYTAIFSPLPAGTELGRCFPGGHSSGGYAWVALYYFALQVNPKYRWAGLAFGVTLGLSFSITQQLRGAHFFSHGIWSLAISWFVASGYYYLLFASKRSGKNALVMESNKKALNKPSAV